MTNVTSLLKTVKTVEDEAARGTRALEASIEAIGQEVRVRPMANLADYLIACVDYANSRFHQFSSLPKNHVSGIL